MVLLIAVPLATFVYREVVNIVEKEAKSSNLAILQQVQEVVDEKLNRIDSLILQMNWNSKIRFLLDQQNSLKDSIYEVREVYTDISYYLNTDEELYIYFKNMDALISPKGSYTKLDLIYGSIIQYGDMDFQTFKDNILNKYYFKKFFPATKTVLSENKGSKILCIQSLPMEIKDKNKGNILYFLDEKVFLNLINNLNTQNGGYAYIADENNNVLTYYGDYDSNNVEGYGIDYECCECIDNQDMIVSYTKSQDNGWSYVAVLPKKVVLKRVDYIEKLFILVLCIYIVIGSIIAYLLAYRNVKPLKDIIIQLRDRFKNDESSYKNEYLYIKENIVKLIDKNDQLKNSIEFRMPIVKDAFIEKLLRGEYTNKQEADNLISHIGLKLDGMSYCTILINLCGYYDTVNREIIDELGVKRVIVKTIINEYMKYKSIQVDIDVDKVALVIYFKENSKEAISTIDKDIRQIHRILLSDYGIRILASGGNIYSDVLDITYSYFQSLEASSYKTVNSHEIIVWYSKMIRKSNKYYYSMEVEQRIINYTKIGDQNQIDNIFRIMYKENFEERDLNADMTWQLFYEIRATLNKVIQSRNLDTNHILDTAVIKLNYLYKAGNIEEIFDNLKSVFIKVCNIINDNKKSHNELLKTNMVDFINNNYNDSNLCLGLIATKLEVSEAYLSQFFKEQVGVKFTNYVEDKRINKAIELLKCSKMAIKDIAIHVGYNSSHAFRRAFKKVTGVVPSEYR